MKDREFKDLGQGLGTKVLVGGEQKDLRLRTRGLFAFVFFVDSGGQERAKIYFS